MANLNTTFETCKNPWKEKCKRTDIEVYIYFKNKSLPICRKCWTKIADKNLDW